MTYLVIAGTCLAGSEALAQRGGLSVVKEPGPPSAISDLPGFLDTHTLPRGRCVVSVPFLTLDCGVTDDLSLGIVGSLALLPLDKGAPSINLRARVRVHESARWKLTTDLVIGYARGRDYNLVAGWLGQNASLRVAARHSLLLNVGLGQAAEWTARDGASITALVVGLGHEWLLSPRTALSSTVLVVPIVRAGLESLGSSQGLEIDPSDDVLQRTALRSVFTWRVRRSVALTAGVIYTPALDVALLPWGSFDVIW